MSGQLIALLTVGGTLLTAIGGAVGALITGRATANKTTAEARVIDAKLPPEVDSIVVQGAEQAVLVMGRALDSAQNRIKALEDEAVRLEEERKRERAADRERMAELEAEVKELRRKVAESERTSAEARKAADKFAIQLRDALAEQDNRKR